jgi:hypothetical protein
MPEWMSGASLSLRGDKSGHVYGRWGTKELASWTSYRQAIVRETTWKEEAKE